MVTMTTKTIVVTNAMEFLLNDVIVSLKASTSTRLLSSLESAAIERRSIDIYNSSNAIEYCSCSIVQFCYSGYKSCARFHEKSYTAKRGARSFPCYKNNQPPIRMFGWLAGCYIPSAHAVRFSLHCATEAMFSVARLPELALECFQLFTFMLLGVLCFQIPER